MKNDFTQNNGYVVIVKNGVDIVAAFETEEDAQIFADGFNAASNFETAVVREIPLFR